MKKTLTTALLTAAMLGVMGCSGGGNTAATPNSDNPNQNATGGTTTGGRAGSGGQGNTVGGTPSVPGNGSK